MKTFDINVSSPDKLADVLRSAAQAFRESTEDLRSTWQDDQAGRVWAELARVLESAAMRSDLVCEKFFR